MLDLKLFIIPVWFPYVWSIVLALSVIWRGGWRERIIAAWQLFQVAYSAVLISLGIYWKDGLPYPIWRSLASSAALLVICLVCARRTKRYPLLWASSFALLSVVTDLMGLFAPGVTVWAYVSANIVWSYLLGVCVVWSALSSPRGVGGGPWRRLAP